MSSTEGTITLINPSCGKLYFTSFGKIPVSKIVYLGRVAYNYLIELFSSMETSPEFVCSCTKFHGGEDVLHAGGTYGFVGGYSPPVNRNGSSIRLGCYSGVAGTRRIYTRTGRSQRH